MRKGILGLVVSTCLLFSAGQASATVIQDNYYGHNSFGSTWNRDVIGDSSVFDIQSMNVTVTGTVLNVSINTNFAGDAGVDANYVTNGIGYGDLFLSSSWNPYGSAPYIDDKASNGTVWNYGISLDNRWSNTGGVGTLYSLNSGNNLTDTLLSNDFIDCTKCVYRDGQEVAVNTASNGVSALNTGSWSVDAANKTVNFSIDLAGTNLLGSNIGVHWGMTCDNDVIEGAATVPEPSALMLLGLGLLGLGFTSRKRFR